MPTSQRSRSSYAAAVGARLRAVRTARGLSLLAVEHQSGGRWTSIVVGSYERNDRAVTVVKLAGLAEFYGVPTEELLPADAAPSVVDDRNLTIDLRRLAALPSGQAGPLARYAATIQSQRGQDNRTVLVIREQDLQSLAVVYDLGPDSLTELFFSWGVLTGKQPTGADQQPA
jgi:transcriptional regulator with XRE-family HTH domain